MPKIQPKLKSATIKNPKKSESCHQNLFNQCQSRSVLLTASTQPCHALQSLGGFQAAKKEPEFQALAAFEGSSSENKQGHTSAMMSPFSACTWAVAPMSRITLSTS